MRRLLQITRSRRINSKSTLGAVMFSTRYWIFFLIVLAAISYSMYQLTSVNTPISSPQDERKYEYLTLKNGLKVLLVSTPKAEKAAAAVTVAVGSGNDPKGREGLVHFLEHMLFLGTRSEERRVGKECSYRWSTE